jgi:hypothetical protein
MREEANRMTTTMTETESQPAEEQRGGEHPDWDQAHPGEELPSKPDPELWDPPEDPRFADDPEPEETNEQGWMGRLLLDLDSRSARSRQLVLLGSPDDDDDCGRDDADAVPLYAWCGLPGCGGD